MAIKVFILCPWLTGQLHKVILIDVSRWQAQSTCVWDAHELINFIYVCTDRNKDWLTHLFMSSESDGSFASPEWWVLTKAPLFHSPFSYLSEFCCCTKCCLSWDPTFLPPMLKQIEFSATRPDTPHFPCVLKLWEIYFIAKTFPHPYSQYDWEK